MAENKNEEFREYLEKKQVFDVLTSAFVELYFMVWHGMDFGFFLVVFWLGRGSNQFIASFAEHEVLVSRLCFISGSETGRSAAFFDGEVQGGKH